MSEQREVAEAWDWLMRVHDSDPSQERLKIVRDHVDQLTEALERERGFYVAMDVQCQRAEADLAATNEALEAWKGHTRSAEADLADEKRRHAKTEAKLDAAMSEQAKARAELLRLNRRALHSGGEDR